MDRRTITARPNAYGPMLQKLYVDNYKCLVNFELPLQELSLLLGLNGTGKTSVLEVVHALAMLLDGRARITDDDVFPATTLTRWQQRDLQVFEIQVRLNADSFTYRIEVEHQRLRERARVRLERLTGGGRPLFECRQGEVQLYRDDHSEGPRYTASWSESALARVVPGKDDSRLTSFMDFMEGVVVCGISPPSLRTESRRESRILGRDARNFSDWYRHVLLERPDLATELTSTLREVIDGLSGVRLERVGRDTRAFMIVFEEGGERYELRLDEVSDGQRALIVLYALIHLSKDQGYTLLLDDPDNYVTLPEIQPWLMALSDACGEAVHQAVLCSHHPELIDYLGGDSGLLLRREQSGVVTARRPEAEDVEDGLKLSELIARGWVG